MQTQEPGIQIKDFSLKPACSEGDRLLAPSPGPQAQCAKPSPDYQELAGTTVPSGLEVHTELEYSECKPGGQLKRKTTGPCACDSSTSPF